MDFIFNGQASGSVASRLLAHNMDPGAMRPFIGRDGRSYVTVNTGKVVQNKEGLYVPERKTLLTNAPASLRIDEWKLMDRAIMRAAQSRLRAVADLRSRGLEMRLPNGMAHTMLQYQTMGNITGATIGMDPARRSQEDRPEFDYAVMPLPVIYKDFSFTLREILVSRNGGPGLDTTTGEMASRRVAELAEELLIGTASSFSFGGGTVYGYTNHPGRQTFTLTDPTDVGWTPATLIGELLEMKQLLINDRMFGPYKIYWGTGWGTILDNDYSDAKGDITVRQRINQIEGFGDQSTLDGLTGYQVLVVQMTSDVVREVVGFDITTLQWDENGGQEQHFKVMAMLIPQIRVDPDSNSGIVHANV